MTFTQQVKMVHKIVSQRALKRRAKAGGLQYRLVKLQREDVILEGQLMFGDIHHATGKDVPFIETIGQPSLSPTVRDYRFSCETYNVPLHTNDIITVLEDYQKFVKYKVKLQVN